MQSSIYGQVWRILLPTCHALFTFNLREGGHCGWVLGQSSQFNDDDHLKRAAPNTRLFLPMPHSEPGFPCAHEKYGKQYLSTWKCIHLRCTNNISLLHHYLYTYTPTPQSIFVHLHQSYWISKIIVLLVASAKLACALIMSNGFVPCGWAWMQEITAENCSYSCRCCPMSFFGHFIHCC